MTRRTPTASDSTTRRTTPYPERLATSTPSSPASGRARSIYRGLRARLQTARRSDPPAPDHFLDEPTRLLILAMGLPLVDGVFASIVLSGALETALTLIVTGLTVFGGPWMLTVIVSEMAGDSIPTRLRRVLIAAGLVVPAAGLEAIAAPTIASVLHMPVFHLFSAIVILSVGAMIANDGLADRLPAPKWLVVAGAGASVGANVALRGTVEFAPAFDPVLVGQAMAASGIASTLAAGAAIVGPTLDDWLQMDRFGLGSGIALALIPFSIFGVLPELSSLAVFALAVVFSLDLNS